MLAKSTDLSTVSAYSRHEANKTYVDGSVIVLVVIGDGIATDDSKVNVLVPP